MRKLGFKLFFAACMAISMTSCDSCGGGGQDDLCDHGKANAPAFKTYLEKQTIKQIIDYRSEEKYNAGHIPDAINIPFVSAKQINGSNGDCEYVKLALDNFDANIPLFVYGEDAGFGIQGNSIPGQLACKFKDVTLLEGGYSKWTGAGYPEEK